MRIDRSFQIGYKAYAVPFLSIQTRQFAAWYRMVNHSIRLGYSSTLSRYAVR